MSFAHLGLSQGLASAVEALGIAEPSPVQRLAVPAMLGGASVVAVARTGSGKTLAYALPLLQRVRDLEDAAGGPAPHGRPRAVVLTGTRELVDQTLKAIKGVAHPAKVRVRSVSGGMGEREQRKRLAEGADVLVANPPRLAALVKAGVVDLRDAHVCVVDEADTLLSPGQRGDVEFLLGRLPKDHQVGFFSATLPEPIRAWVLARPERPTLLLAKDAHQAPETVTVRNERVRPNERPDVLHDLLVAWPASERGILFVNRRETADEVGAWLRERGHDVLVIHGGHLPDDRRREMAAFRAGRARVLVTTELGGRGLHVEGLAFVVNYELPEKPSEYLHRVGRVGRQGAVGRVVNLVTDADVRLLAEVERLAKGGRLDTGEALRGARERPPPKAKVAPRRKREGQARGRGGRKM
ncbi:MAG: DEAD/DEAH box helicase [Myxococcota bacterium]